MPKRRVRLLDSWNDLGILGKIGLDKFSHIGYNRAVRKLIV